MSHWCDRIVLALDATAEASAAIDLAVRLAARAKLRLHAVFVEDQELLHLAGSSFAREVVAGGGGGPLCTEEVELHLRAAASRSQENVRAALRDHALEFSFEIIRGPAEAALSIVGEHDLVIAGGLARPVAGYFRLDSRWPASLTTTPGSFLLTKERRGSGGGVAVLLRGRGTTATRLLQTAARVAQLEGGLLTVICRAALAAAKDLGEWVEAQTAFIGVRPQIETAPADWDALRTRIAELDCGLLALDVTATEREQLSALTKRLGCDVLVVN